MRRFFRFVFDMMILRFIFGLIFGLIMLPFRLIFSPFGFHRHCGYGPYRRFYW